MNDPTPTLAELPPPPPGRSGWPWTEMSAWGSQVALEPPSWPRISIITPSYNQAQFIEETIRSVLLQNYTPLEYIVVDGGSNDGTLEILRRYETWLSWISEPDSGQTDAINKGLRMATGDVLAYLNSDDIYFLNGVRIIADYMRRRPELGLVYGDCRVLDEAGKAIGDLPRHPFDLRRTIERGEFLPQQATFWRREAMAKVGMFDDTLHYAMDYEYFIRLARTFPVGYVSETVAGFRMQATSKTVSQSERHWREALRVSERHGLGPWNPWYWIRRLRHWGLRLLPDSIQGRMRRRLGRAHDPYLYMDKP
jgi:glycosyltransferase involved in cell wall biosynthesis